MKTFFLAYCIFTLCCTLNAHSQSLVEFKVNNRTQITIQSPPTCPAPSRVAFSVIWRVPTSQSALAPSVNIYKFENDGTMWPGSLAIYNRTIGRTNYNSSNNSNETLISGEFDLDASVISFGKYTAVKAAFIPVGSTSNSFTNAVATPYSLNPATPVISNISPSNGREGDIVSISGTGFIYFNRPVVKFNGQTTTFDPSSNPSCTMLSVYVPAGATSGPITVESGSGAVSNSVNFTVLPSTPLISSLSPSSGLIGTSVTIFGSRFTSSTIVNLNGAGIPSASFISSTQISFIVPANATSGTVNVSNNNGTSNGVTFTLLAPPVISRVDPNRGRQGAVVTIYGAGFTNASGALFNGISASSFTLINDNAIRVTVPAGSITGQLTLTTSGVSSNGVMFTRVCDMPAPVLSGTTPLSVCVNGSVTATIQPVPNAATYTWYLNSSQPMTINGQHVFTTTSTSVTIDALNSPDGPMTLSVSANSSQPCPDLPNLTTVPIYVGRSKLGDLSVSIACSNIDYCNDGSMSTNRTTVGFYPLNSDPAAQYTWTVTTIGGNDPQIISGLNEQSLSIDAMQYGFMYDSQFSLSLTASNSCGVSTTQNYGPYDTRAYFYSCPSCNDYNQYRGSKLPKSNYKQPIAITLYPNPASSEINIAASSVDAEGIKSQKLSLSGSLYSNRGEKVKFFKGDCSPDLPLKVKTDDLPEGLYYIMIEQQGGMVTRKAIVISR